MNTNSLILTLLNLKNWGPNKVYDYVLAHSFDYNECVKWLDIILTDDEKNLFNKELVNSNNLLEKNLYNGINACNILDYEFPKKLYSSKQKCVFLFYKGNINLLSEKAIAIIGTRHPTEYFIELGVSVTKYFAKKGFVIVSGLALGCDTIAHTATLEVDGKTIAVLPSSCDNILPSSNKALANQIVKKGGLLISEYGTCTITKYNYPNRDRIQSLLSDALIIIQATDESGTMYATRKSISDGKPVYALKGNDLTIVDKYVDVNSKEELEQIENIILKK